MWDLVAIFGIAVLGGGAAPLLARWSDRSLHVALALSTGLFLGAVFLHLLPEIAVPLESAAGADSHAALTGHDHDAHLKARCCPHCSLPARFGLPRSKRSCCAPTTTTTCTGIGRSAWRPSPAFPCTR
ncbi:MAG: hypothetical protein R3F17_15385 [Planctomycetota bacterium]